MAKPLNEPWSDFIPGTCERKVSAYVVFRPIRSWHSLTYAGEGIKIVNSDRSGCVDDNGRCSPPKTVTHRVYWRTDEPSRCLSSFLSYPGAMGYFGQTLEGQYFWEIYPVGKDVERFATEIEMEARVIELLGEEPPR